MAASGNLFLNESKEEEDLCFLPATTLIRLFKSKTISPVNLLEAQIAQINRYNPSLNAVSANHFEEAMAQAKESEKRYKEGNERPLEGITCAVKDEVDVVGWRTTMGTLISKDHPPAKEDAPLTAFLRNAGLVLHVQTSVPEYYCNLVTWNYLTGVCRNPWNAAYTSGGSSGGSGASLAAGFTTLATGSDMGGSIRVPASMSALFGFKPPFGRVSTSHVFYESEGPMARTFGDLCLFQNAIAGPSPRVLSTMEEKLHYPLSYSPIDKIRIAYDPMSNWGVPVDASVKYAMAKAVTTLRQLGAEVVEVDLGFRASDFEMYASGIFSTSIGSFCFKGPKQFPEKVTPYIANLVKKYGTLPNASEHQADVEAWIDAKHRELQEKVFNQFTAIIMPTMCSPYLKADMGTNPGNTIITINDQQHSALNWTYSFTWHWNMLGYYPVVNVPIDMTREQIPIGMQIIGNKLKDLDAFRVAAAWSQAGPTLFQRGKRPDLDGMVKQENFLRNEL